MIGIERVWKFPEQPVHPLALSVEKTAWLSDQRDLRKAQTLNFVFKRVMVAVYRHHAYVALTTDQDLLARTEEKRYQAPINMIRASLAANIRIAVCALHDRSSDSFSLTKFVDAMFKDGFAVRATEYHTKACKEFDVAKEFASVKSMRDSFNNPQAIKDLRNLKSLRDSILAHFGLRNMSEPPSADWDNLTDKAFIASFNLLLTIRRTFVGHYEDKTFGDAYHGKPAWQAAHLIQQIRPPG